MYFPTFVAALSSLLVLTSAQFPKVQIPPGHDMERGCCNPDNGGAWKNKATTDCCNSGPIAGFPWHWDRPNGGRIACRFDKDQKEDFMQCCIKAGQVLHTEDWRACRLI